MIVVLVVVGVAVALCVAGWVPTVRQALRADVVLPGPTGDTVNAPTVDPGFEPAPDAQPIPAPAG